MSNTQPVSEEMWGFLQKHLGYSNEEMDSFKKDARWQKAVSKTPVMVNKTIVFEVVESKNCNIQHKIGDRFYFSAAGYMLAHKGPKKVCPFLMPAMARLVALVMERFYEGVDPLPLFYRGHCDDVGFKCGGWGTVVIETRIEDKA